MASNKMLIDASHPEETRVVVLRGNRIDEFDFESQNKRQLKGNIYLAKVTRVEPSLQAAFVDYGGNRHGFLAFNEIHPDYYQIPVADRQALLEEEAEDARRDSADEDNDVDTSDIDEEDTAQQADATTGEDNDAGEADAKTKRRKRRPRRKTAATKSTDEQEGSEPDSVADEPPAESSISADSSEGNNTGDDNDDDDTASPSMAAMIETDSISEPVSPEDEPEDVSPDAETRNVVEEEAPAPRKRSTRRPRKKAKPAPEPVSEDETGNDSMKSNDSEDTPQKAPSEVVAEKTDNDESQHASDDNGDDTPSDPKPKTRRKRRSSRARTKKADQDETPDAGEDEDGNDVETSGQEDAMEELPPRRRLRRQYKIQEVIKRRQVLLVQVVKEERGNKGAALTTYLSLAGRYSVLMPNTARGGGISRKITNAADRKRLKSIANSLDVPEGMGVILRTAGASRDNAEIERDFEYLMRLWENVRELTLSSSAPCLVYEEGSLIKRSIRDLYGKNTGDVIVAGESGYAEARAFMEMLMPSHVDRVKLYHDEQAMFARFGVEQQLDKMLSQQVTLKSGGYLVIDQTEALVAIDVNSGRATREHSIEDTALQTNLETAEEVARQLRLRDLAGLIVIDFIDMEENRNNRAVEKKLKECLKHDRARIQVGRISHFGLLEMSRQRMRASVLDSTMDVCPHCMGKGHQRSSSSVGLHILRSIEEHLLKNSRFDIIVRASTDISLYILNQKRTALTEIENRFGVKIFIEGSRDLLGENFTIEKGDASTGERKPLAHIQAGQVTGDMIEEAGNEDNAPKRKRRRRRGKNSPDDDQKQMDSTEESAKTGDNNDQTNAAEAEEDKPAKKKRTRGKRGGRKSAKTDSAKSVDGETENATQSATEETSANTEPEASDVKKRNSRPGKKKPANKVTPEPETSRADNADSESEPPATSDVSEPPRAKRRATTRRRSVKKDSEAAGDNNGSDDLTQTDESLAAATEDSGGETDKKKGGWWSRNGFFK